MAGQSQQFTTTVTGTTNQAVTWSLSPALGTINATGLYVAPATLSSPQTLLVSATSQADPTKVATATVTVSPGTTDEAMVGPVSPDSGSGRTQLFRFDARARSGELVWVQMLLNQTLSPTFACLVYYDPPSDLIFLSSDDSQPSYNTWVGSAVLGTPGASLSNSQCTIDVANSSVEKSGASVSIRLSITFADTWSGTKYIYMAAEDSGGERDEWRYLGYWVVP